MSHSTDVYLACHCDQCHGAEAVVTARKMKFIRRLASPAHEQAIHDAVTASLLATGVRYCDRQECSMEWAS